MPRRGATLEHNPEISVSLEQKLEENTAAVLALEATIKKAMAAGVLPGGKSADAPAPAATTEEPAKRGPGRPKKDDAPAAPKVTFDEMKAAVLKVKDAKGKAAAEAVIKDVGGAEKMADIKAEKFAAVLAACEAALAPAPEPAKTDDDDL